MRRTYKKAYCLPSDCKTKPITRARKSLPLLQPAWDDTIHDLTTYRASPEDVLRRKLSRTSHNKMGMALVSQSRSACSGGQQARYTPTSAFDDDDELSECNSSTYSARAQQPSSQLRLQHSPTARQQSPQHDVQRQQQQQQLKQHQLAQHHLQQYGQQASGSASVQAQYACSAAGSEDDVCQWQSPLQPAAQQHRQVLQSIMNSQQQDSLAAGLGVAAGGKRPAVARKFSYSSPQHWEAGNEPLAGAPTVAVDADMMQVLLDKISLLEQQLQQRGDLQQHASGGQDSCRQELPNSVDLKQQLAESQQQLAATQQQVHQLQDEHRQYVAHVSTLLTQLQTQVQQLMMSQQQPQQQQGNPLPPSNPLYPAALAAGRRAATTDEDSSRLLQISSFIRQQLPGLPGQQQRTQATPAGADGRAATTTTAAPAAAAGLTSSGMWADPAAVTGSMASNHSTDRAQAAPEHQFAGAGSSRPSASQAAVRMAGAPVTQPAAARSSPGRKRSDMVFTPAFTDTVSLPSYAAMRQHNRAVAAHAGGTQPLGVAESSAKSRASPTTKGAAAAATAARAHAGDSSSCEAPSSIHVAAAVGSPKRLYTTPVPRPLPAAAADSSAGPQVTEQQHWQASSSANSTRLEKQLPPVQLPAASAAAAAVWEAELMSSPRPQQLQVPPEQLHYHLSRASAQTVSQEKAAPVQSSGDLAALLRDLGLASLEIQDLEASQQPVQHGDNGSSGSATGASAATRETAERGVSPVQLLSESAAAPAAALAPSLLSSSRGDGVLAGALDVDRGLQEGLPRAAISRLFTAAGCVSDRGVEPRAVLGRLQNNMCLRDHVRAAAAKPPSLGA